MEGAARHFFITELGQKVLLLWLAPGDAFGGRALLIKPSSYLCGTETVKDSRALLWPRNTIRELAARYPRFWENALSIASDYFAWFLSAHLALISHNARERLAQVLLSLAEGIGHDAPDGVELNITNEELANAANVTLFTASRILSEWRRNGALLNLCEDLRVRKALRTHGPRSPAAQRWVIQIKIEVRPNHKVTRRREKRHNLIFEAEASAT